MTRFLLPLFALAFISAPAFAEDAKPTPATPPTAASAPASTPAKTAETSPTPVMPTTPAPATASATSIAPAKSAAAANAGDQAKQAFNDIKALANKLNPDDQKHFYLIYSDSNIISTVKMVRGDVNNAVNACGKSNADLKPELDKHFTDWKSKVDPVVKESEANLNNMIIAQTYAPPEKIKAILKKLDDVRAKTAAQVEKKPVTTKDACQYLESKLDSTQDSLTAALRSTLISFGRASSSSEMPADNKGPTPNVNP